MKVEHKLAPEGATHWAEDQRCYSKLGIQYYRLTGEKWFYWGEGTGSGWQACISPCKPVNCLVKHKGDWNGEGLPPVGTVCEFRVAEDDWRQCEVIAHKSESAVCWIHCNKILSTGGASVRPIRTPEQIAAEEREAGIDDMVSHVKSGIGLRALCEQLFYAGYRKQVKP